MGKARKKVVAPPPPPPAPLSTIEELRIKRRSEEWKNSLMERCALKWGHPFHAESTKHLKMVNEPDENGNPAYKDNKPILIELPNHIRRFYQGGNVGLIQTAIVLRDDSYDVVMRSEPDTRKRRVGVHSLGVLITQMNDAQNQLTDPTHPFIEKLRREAEAFLSACVFTPRQGGEEWIQAHGDLNRAITQAIPVAKLRNPDTAFIETISIPDAVQKYGIDRVQFWKACQPGKNTPAKIRTINGEMRVDDVNKWIIERNVRKQAKVKATK